MKIKQEFLKGINYWPINKAMYWWRNFDSREVERDFAQLAKYELKTVRIFLSWEDFQPHPDLIAGTALSSLRITADLAKEHGLKIIPTFFCGHMSGVNWMPSWMLAPSSGIGRFPVFSLGSYQPAAIKNFYIEPEIIEAQLLQIQQVCSVLKGHEAVFAYDLGNESSNCCLPPHREAARTWLEKMSSAIRYHGGNAAVTLGMHAEDLEEDRQLWPQDAALYCDFLSMHAYPFYHSWAYDNLDINILLLMGAVTAWLGKKAVLLGEFGLPTRPLLPPYPSEDYENLKCPLWDETVAADYYRETLQFLQEARMIGALAWCFADYSPVLWDKPPLADNCHERHFGLFRHDGSAKPAAVAFKQAFKNEDRTNITIKFYNHLDKFDRNSFYKNPKNNLQKLYSILKEIAK